MKNKTITFNTGRKYSPSGQVIVATEFGTYDSQWFFQDEPKEQYIIFNDLTRNIKGRIDFCKLYENDIMRCYDNNNYTSI